MYTKNIFTILGGDRRQEIVAQKLVERGHTVRLFGIKSLSTGIEGADIYTNHEKAIKGSSALLLPLPTSRDGIHLALPSSSCNAPKIRLSDIVELAARSGCGYILGGMIPENMISLAKSAGLTVDDYYNDEQLQIKNALPSAEGAVMLAMEHTDKVLSGMSILVSGYGRIGKCLADILYKLGAKVRVAARRDESLCEAALMGYKTVLFGSSDTSHMKRAVNESDVIFNTVPHVVFTRSVIQETTRKPLYIEIASSPGGIDLSAARDADIEVVFAPSIPGKYAPHTAGLYIYESINDILKKRGINV